MIPPRPGDQLVSVDAEALTAARFDLVLISGRYRLYGTHDGFWWELRIRWPFVRRRRRCILLLQFIGP
jgi:hypothetical protein